MLADLNRTHSGVGNGPETETISCGRKLSDLHINYAQQLLKGQFPNLNGLQSTLFQSMKQARGTAKNQLQVIHSGEDHWNVASTVGSKDGVVLVFDSVYTKTTAEIICNLFGNATEVVDIQKQEVQITQCLQLLWLVQLLLELTLLHSGFHKEK